jgi:hypothetical protein
LHAPKRFKSLQYFQLPITTTAAATATAAAAYAYGVKMICSVHIFLPK